MIKIRELKKYKISKGMKLILSFIEIRPLVPKSLRGGGHANMHLEIVISQACLNLRNNKVKLSL
jgi:hypothetical protein